MLYLNFHIIGILYLHKGFYESFFNCNKFILLTINRHIKRYKVLHKKLVIILKTFDSKHIKLLLQIMKYQYTLL